MNTQYDYRFHPWRVKGDARIVTAERAWKRPLNWHRVAIAMKERDQVFCAVDVFEDWNGIATGADGEPRWERDGRFVGFGEEDDTPMPSESGIGLSAIRDRLFRLIDATPNLDWVISTKWPENIAKMTPPAPACGRNYHIKGRIGALRLEVIRHNLSIVTEKP